MRFSTLVCGLCLLTGGVPIVADQSVDPVVGDKPLSAWKEEFSGKALMVQLLRLGPRAKPANSVIVEFLAHEDPFARKYALMSLKHIGARTEHVPALINVLQNRSNHGEFKKYSEDVSVFALLRLAELGRSAEAALPALHSTLQMTRKSGSGRRLSIVAAYAIACVDPSDQEMIPLLVDRLRKYEGKPYHLHVVDLLGQLGQRATSALPILKNTFEQGTMVVRRHAARAILRIDPQNNEALLWMRSNLTDGSSRNRVFAASFIAREGAENSKDGVDTLIDMLVNSESRHRSGVETMAAAGALAKLGAVAQPALPALREVLADNDNNTHETVSRAIKNIEFALTQAD